MTCLLLFYEFFKTGLFAVGGGLATLPFLYDMAARHPEWFTVSQLADMLAVSESTPGPLGVNMATYVGYLTAGIPGAVAATMGLVAPSVIVILIVAAFLKRFRESRLVNNVFYGLRPASAAMVAAAGLSVVRLALLYGGQAGLAAVNWKAVALAAVLLVLTRWCKPTKGRYILSILCILNWDKAKIMFTMAKPSSSVNTNHMIHLNSPSDRMRNSLVSKMINWS